MSVKARILALIFSAIVLACLVAGFGLVSLNGFSHLLNREDRDAENLQYAERLDDLVRLSIADSRGVYSARTPSEALAFETELKQTLVGIDQLMKQWQSAAVASDSIAFLHIQTEAVNFSRLRQKFEDLSFRTPVSEERNLAARTAREDQHNALEADLARFSAAMRARASGDLLGSQQLRHIRIDAVIFVTLAGALAILTTAILVVRYSITRPIKHISDAILQLAETHYKAPVPQPRGKDEFAGLWGALTVLRDKTVEADRQVAEQYEETRQRERKMRELLLD